ncbi:MAG: J domain-containing protein [candidate division WOR-3 bacterium]
MSCLGFIILFIIISFIFGPAGSIIFVIIFTISSLLNGLDNLSIRNKNTNQNSFYDPFIDILSIFSYISLLDGVVSKDEVDYVKSFLLSLYPNNLQRVQYLMNQYKKFNENPELINIDLSIGNINRSAGYEEKLSIFSLIVDLSLKSKRSDTIRSTLFQIGSKLKLNTYDINSILNYYDSHFKKGIDQRKRWYSILGVSEDSSDEEVKRAYRELVKKTHPDKLRNMPENVIKDAENRFKEINEAYNNIKIERGLS